MTSWRDSAHAHIEKHYREYRAECDSSVSDEKILAIINRNHYPFGEREMLPYKSWCQAMREWKAKLGIPVIEKEKKRKCGCWHKEGKVTQACAAHQAAWQGVLL